MANKFKKSATALLLTFGLMLGGVEMAYGATFGNARNGGKGSCSCAVEFSAH